MRQITPLRLAKELSEAQARKEHNEKNTPVEQWETLRLKIDELLTHFNLKHNEASPADFYELNYIKKQIDFLEKLMTK